MEVLVTDVTGELSRIERRPPSLETGLSGELINGRLNRVGLRAPAAGANGELSCNNRRPRALVTGVDGVLSCIGELVSHASGNLGEAYLSRVCSRWRARRRRSV